MPDDALWYEAAFVVGMTNALNVVADSLAPQPGVTLLEAVEEGSAEQKTAAIFAEIRTFYARPDTPVPFRLMAHDPAYLAEVWQAVRHAFTEQRLTRRLKEALAFAVSVTSRSAFGTAFHLAEMRRLGVSEGGVMEVLGVTQMFSSYTKIADTLQLDPDMGQIAPIDWSPAPGGPARAPATAAGA
jgi:alkylhydroperoxidase/carboxymuconolactone decarboxylase family protein YurZ